MRRSLDLFRRGLPRSTTSTTAAFTLIELLVVIAILAILIALLLPMLSRMRKRVELMQSLASPVDTHERLAVSEAMRNVPRRLPARVPNFDAAVTLTPHLSVGTAEPESIYEAAFSAKLLAGPALEASGGEDLEQEIAFPLPPQIISLAGLTLLIDGIAAPAEALSNAGPFPAPTPFAPP